MNHRRFQVFTRPPETQKHAHYDHEWEKDFLHGGKVELGLFYYF